MEVESVEGLACEVFMFTESLLMDNGLGMRATSNSISDFHILSSIERKSVHGKRLIVHQKGVCPCVFSKESVKNDH